MNAQRPQNETRSETVPARGTFRSSSGVTNQIGIPFGLSSMTQSTSSYRSGRGGHQLEIGPMNRQQYHYFLATQGRRKYDTGHSFHTEKSERSISHRNVTVRGLNGVVYNGPLIMNYVPSGTYIPIPPFASDVYGAQLVRQAIPTSPLNNAAVTLGEFIQPGGIPKAYTKQILSSPGLIKPIIPFGSKKGYKKYLADLKLGAKRSGDFALNYQFGYAPIASDVVGAVGAINMGAKYIEQLKRDSGKTVRRQRHAATVATYNDPVHMAGSVSLTSLGHNISADRASLYRSSADAVGSVSMTESTSQKIWFSGGFRFHFETPMSYDKGLESVLKQVDKLSGLGLTAERLYQLTPFTWLVDWNCSLGDVISNAQRFSEDGLIMLYGYVMRTSVTIRTYTLSGIKFRQFDPGPITTTYRSVRKERFRGDPFGFGSNPQTYNSRQWGLLSAVGMTQGTGTTIRGR